MDQMMKLSAATGMNSVGLPSTLVTLAVIHFSVFDKLVNARFYFQYASCVLRNITSRSLLLIHSNQNEVLCSLLKLFLTKFINYFIQLQKSQLVEVLSTLHLELLVSARTNEVDSSTLDQCQACFQFQSSSKRLL